MKYVIGAIIFICFGYFCYKQIRSIISDVRGRCSKKSPEEGAEQGTEQNTDVSGKEVNK